jgi:glycosyltransferase involved in cell wall biosynthesis
MTIGIDASQANRRIRSGTEWYAFYLIKQFGKLLGSRPDIRVRLYFRTEPRTDLIAGLPDNFELKLLRWPIRHLWSQGRLSLEMLFDPPDILFSPAHTIPVIHPKNTFTTLHDIGFEEFPELYDRLSLWYHRFSARLAVRRARHIFTISNFTKQKIIERYDCPAEKISAIYLGYDADKFKPLSREVLEPVLKKYGLEYKNYLLYVGRIEPKKNIQGTIGAYLRSGVSQPLALAGRIVKKPETENTKVKFLGYIDEQDKPALLAGASVFVFPTFYEGFGLPIIEAQACGTPVLTSSTTSNPEIAGRGAMIVDPKDTDGVAEAISELLDSESLRRELVQKGFENIKRFDWRETTKTTLATILAKSGQNRQV